MHVWLGKSRERLRHSAVRKGSALPKSYQRLQGSASNRRHSRKRVRKVIFPKRRSHSAQHCGKAAEQIDKQFRNSNLIDRFLAAQGNGLSLFCSRDSNDHCRILHSRQLRKAFALLCDGRRGAKLLRDAQIRPNLSRGKHHPLKFSSHN